MVDQSFNRWFETNERRHTSLSHILLLFGDESERELCVPLGSFRFTMTKTMPHTHTHTHLLLIWFSISAPIPISFTLFGMQCAVCLLTWFHSQATAFGRWRYERNYHYSMSFLLLSMKWGMLRCEVVTGRQTTQNAQDKQLNL